MSVLSRLAIAASQLDHTVKIFLRGLLAVGTIAAAGSSEADATAITTGKVMVTAADGTKGVILPVGELDMAIEVVNTESAQDLKVYPNTGAQINSLTATTGAFTVPGGATRTFYCDAALHWYVSAGVAANSAELDVLNGVTPGTQAASKAIVNDANANQGIAKVTELHIGASGSETQVVATALEINRAADVSTRLVAAGATLAVTVAAHDGKTIKLDTAGGSVCTLPVAAATGARIRFAVTVRPSGGSHVIKVGNASDFIAGQINLLDLDAAAQGAFQGDGSADDTITINNTTTGGAIGDYVELEDTLANVWTVVHGALSVPAGSNPADPFSATV